MNRILKLGMCFGITVQTVQIVLQTKKIPNLLQQITNIHIPHLPHIPKTNKTNYNQKTTKMSAVFTEAASFE